MVDKIKELLDKGHSHREIADELKCSRGTVSYHASSVTKAKTKQRAILRHNRESNKVCWKVAEALACAKLIEKGYDVFLPFIENGEIDLIAFKEGTSHKVQVKAASPHEDRVTFSLKRRTSGRYTNIDFFLLYDGKQFYMYDGEQVTLTLRYTLPKNNQTHNISMAEDYLF